MTNNQIPNSKQITNNKFQRYLVEFKRHLELLGFSKRSVEAYILNTDLFLRYLEDNYITSVNEVTKKVAADYQIYIFGQKTKKQAPLKPKTQLLRLVAIRSFFKYLYDKNYILSNPTSSMHLPKVRFYNPRTTLTKKEIFKLLKGPDIHTTQGLRDKAILELLYSSGIRNSELRSLALYDLDIANKQITIREGKYNKSRVVPVGTIALEYIQEYIEKSRPRLLKDEKTDILFIAQHGAMLGRSSLADIVQKYAKKASIKKYTCAHIIRHTCATHLLKNNAPIRYIQELLGHSCLDTTQLYTKVEPLDLKRIHAKTHPREREF